MKCVQQIGFPDVNFFDRDGAQAYQFRNERDCVIACRGTEPNEWNDVKADANAVTALAETVGRVHSGFKAMATICAGRCKVSKISSNPEGLFTDGSPRVGNRAYVNYYRLVHFRWVNNNDIVTRVPPAWLGYRHAGHFSDHSIEDYIDHIHAAVQKQQQAMTQSVPSRRRGLTAVR